MPSQTDAPLVLVDGSSYLYRAFHALPPLTTSQGKPTGAVRGVVAMLRKMQTAYPDSDIVVVFDAKGKTFRDEMYEDYKSHRPPMPDDLREQIEPLHQLVVALGLPMVVHPGVEADDVIGTLAVEAAKRDQPVLISTGDKDMAQLVSERVTLINTMSDTRYDREGVIEKFGVPPELIIDYLAIIGDSSDNIPGVPGVGPKSAAPMLMGVGDLDAIYADLEAVRELGFRGAKKMPEKLIEHREQAFLSRALATIKLDVAVDASSDALKNRAPDSAALKKLYADMEFKGWLAEMDKTGSASASASATSKSTAQALGQNEEANSAVSSPKVDVDYQIILEESAFSAWIAKLNEASEFAFDTETTSIDAMRAELVGVSFAVTSGEASYVPVGHDYLDAPKQLSRDVVLEALRPILGDESKAIIAQNVKYDRTVLANYGVEIHARCFDTMLESYLVNSIAGRHDMDSLAQRYLNRETIHFEDVAGKGAKQLTFNQIALEEAGPYAAEDAEITLCLHQHLWPQIQQQPALEKLYNEIEGPLEAVLARVQRNGTLIDADAMFTQSEELAARLQQLEVEVHDKAGQSFNLGSPKQLQEILYEKLGLPVLKKTPKGQPSTAEEVLVRLADEYEIPKLILEFRGLAKLKSTYTDKLPTMVNASTGRIHTSYHQAVAATGRLSSSDPNLQNIPVRTEEGRRIRKAFVAPPNMRILAADYSQIELRIMAHLSQDPGLIAAFKNDVDVHSATAAEVFDVELTDVTDDQRRKAKAINFGLMYGMSAFGLARQLQIPRHEANDYIDRYFERYPGVSTFMERVRVEAADQGYVETLFGRRLYLPDIGSRNAQRRQAAERTAINAPMQGTAADIIKRAMLSVDRWLRESDAPAIMTMQVHDELVFEVAADHVDEVAKEIIKRMEDAAQLDVPLIVDVGMGGNWHEAH